MREPEFWRGKTLMGRLLSALLSPIGALYGRSVRLKKAVTQPYRPEARVVCVGNLTAGGTGKTPVAIAIGRMLMARGKKIAFLSRGYGGNSFGPVEVDPSHHGAEEVGDEPLLLAAVAPTVVARDRAAGAQLCQSLGAEIIVMDDGHQNFQVAKDLSIVVVNAAEGFGNGKLIPAGPLREPIEEGLARADAVVLTGSGNPKLSSFNGPTLRARTMAISSGALIGQPVFAFAGIANPERFFDLVRLTGADLSGKQVFDDHHVFTPVELSDLKTAAEQAGARLVTTEKDYVRLDRSKREGITPVPVCAMFDDEAAIGALLDRIA